MSHDVTPPHNRPLAASVAGERGRLRPGESSGAYHRPCLALVAALVLAVTPAPAFDSAPLPVPPDRLQSAAIMEVVLGPDPYDPAAPRENLLLTGDAVIHRFPMPGYQHRVLPDGRHQIDTELAAVSRIGTSQIVGGEVTVELSSTQRSLGTVTQVSPGQDFPADGVFDVFVEITTPLGVLHNQNPVRMEARIGRLPPFGFEEMFASTSGPVPLLDPGGAQVGWFGGPFSPGGTCHYNFTSERCLLAGTPAGVEPPPPAGEEETSLAGSASFVLGPDPDDPAAARETVRIAGRARTGRDDAVVLTGGKIHIPTEILELTLEGDSALFGGGVELRTSALLPSPGKLLSLCDVDPGTFPAVSLFDLLLTVETPGGPLANQAHEAAKLEALVEQLPVLSAPHRLAFKPVPLREPGGAVVAWLADLSLGNESPIAIPALVAPGALLLVLLLLAAAVVLLRRRWTAA
jgi:hypothetical protein